VSSSLLLAFGLFCVFEGLFPFLAPGRWRETFLQLARLSDGQIRFFWSGGHPVWYPAARFSFGCFRLLI